MIPKRGGYFCCPYCKKKLIQDRAGAEAKDLPVWCPRCGKQFLINIRSGQCYLSQCPVETE